MTRLFVWPAMVLLLSGACFFIRRYQRRQLSWLDRVDSLRRDGR